MTEKLDNELETKEISQTRNKRTLIPFRDSAIETIDIGLPIEFINLRD